MGGQRPLGLELQKAGKQVGQKEPWEGLPVRGQDLWCLKTERGSDKKRKHYISFSSSNSGFFLLTAHPSKPHKFFIKTSPAKYTEPYTFMNESK